MQLANHSLSFCEALFQSSNEELKFFISSVAAMSVRGSESLVTKNTRSGLDAALEQGPSALKSRSFSTSVRAGSSPAYLTQRLHSCAFQL